MQSPNYQRVIVYSIMSCTVVLITEKNLSHSEIFLDKVGSEPYIGRNAGVTSLLMGGYRGSEAG